MSARATWSGVARRAVIARMRGFREGCLTVRLPGGGVEVLGDPEASGRAELRVLDEAFFARVMLRGEMGAGESYVAGEWASDDLVGVIRLFLRNHAALEFENGVTWLARAPSWALHLMRGNRRSQSARNIHAHYDLGNAFYALMLDPTMAYSCAVFRDGAASLEAAQRAKFELLCAKLELEAGHHLLEIGCGWGGFAMHAAQTRGCRVTAITISREQQKLALERVAAAGLADRVEVQYRDYRDVAGRYDRIASIEMLEAVGHEHLESFFARCGAVLARDGLMALQTIAVPDRRYEAYRRRVDWTQRYIFPGVHIPSLGAITAAMARASQLSVAHLEDIGPDYAPTLRAWRERFTENRGAVRAALGFDAAFERTWRMYLSFSEAAFAERALGDLQLVFRGAGRR